MNDENPCSWESGRTHKPRHQDLDLPKLMLRVSQHQHPLFTIYSHPASGAKTPRISLAPNCPSPFSSDPPPIFPVTSWLTVKRRSLSEAWTPQARGKFRWECRSLVTRGPEAGGSVSQFSGALPSACFCLFLCCSAYPAMRQPAPSGTAQVSLGQPNTVPTPSPASHEQPPLPACRRVPSQPLAARCRRAFLQCGEKLAENERNSFFNLWRKTLREREITSQLKNVTVVQF